MDNSVTACSICNFMKLNHDVEKYVKICKTIASHRGLISEKVSYPECFSDSKTRKNYRDYANNTRRVMVLEKPVFEVLLLNDCFYCGKKNNPPEHYNGIDRIDSNNRNYEKGNVVACCKTCNTLKWTLGQHQFLEHVKNVAIYYDFEDESKHPPTTWAKKTKHPIIL